MEELMGDIERAMVTIVASKITRKILKKGVVNAVYEMRTVEKLKKREEMKKVAEERKKVLFNRERTIVYAKRKAKEVGVFMQFFIFLFWE